MNATTAPLSTTSEGLWLVAALCGVAQLPPVLKIRPIGTVEPTVADHPGVEVLKRAGVVKAGVVDPDVATWVRTLGRPDIEVDITITRPTTTGTAGPPALLKAPADPLEAVRVLAEWHEGRWQRAAALCRRDGSWVAAARLWRTGSEQVDDIEVTPLGIGVGAAVGQLLGPGTPAAFGGINTHTAALADVLTAWQRAPHTDVLAELLGIGLTAPQATLIRAAADAGAARAVITATEFTVESPPASVGGFAVIDSSRGRVLATTTIGFDGRERTTLLPGTGAAIEAAVMELLETLPSGPEWCSHKRELVF